MKKTWIFVLFIVIIAFNLHIAHGQSMKDEDIIILPFPDTSGKIPLETTISERRSTDALYPLHIILVGHKK